MKRSIKLFGSHGLIHKMQCAPVCTLHRCTLVHTSAGAGHLGAHLKAETHKLL